MEVQLQAVIGDILGFNIPATEVTKDNSSEWDSLNHLNLILALEEEFQIEIPAEDFPQLHSSYTGILDYLKQHMS